MLFLRLLLTDQLHHHRRKATASVQMQPAMSQKRLTVFQNGRLCINGKLVNEQLIIDTHSGLIVQNTGDVTGQIVDLKGAVVAPGFIELQTNGVHGFHFTQFDDTTSYESKLLQTARYYATQGVTGFLPTIPTVSSDLYQKVGVCHFL